MLGGMIGAIDGGVIGQQDILHFYHQVSVIDPARHPWSVPAWALGQQMPQIWHRLVGIILGKKTLSPILPLSAALIAGKPDHRQRPIPQPRR
jgi:hypothetical protein